MCNVIDDDWASVLLTKAEHQQLFTNPWKDAIAREGMNVPGLTGAYTNTATLQQVKQAASSIYAEYPEILQALGL